MTEYERQLFNGKCPYTDEQCDRDIDCFKCEIEEAERHCMDDELKISHQLTEQMKKEFKFSDEIKYKLHEVCSYMYEHDLKQISMGYASGVRFRLRMEFEEGSR